MPVPDSDPGQGMARAWPGPATGAGRATDRLRARGPARDRDRMAQALDLKGRGVRRVDTDVAREPASTCPELASGWAGAKDKSFK